MVGRTWCRVELWQTGGFCFGVQRAMEQVQASLRQHGTVYTLGPIIHNPQVVGQLTEQGAHVAQDVCDVPKGATIIIRSHGVAPQVIEACRSHGLTVVDATCPYVKRIHHLVRDMAAQGRSVIVAGEESHPEVQGIVGWAQQAAYVVANRQQVAGLPDLAHVALVAQTTFDQQALGELIDAVTARYPDCVVCDTLCGATRERQRNAHDLARRCDAVVVVGGRNSANTGKLFAIAAEACPNTQWVELPCEIQLERIQSAKAVGIIAGASTPDKIIKEVVNTMSELDMTQATEMPEATPAVETACCCGETCVCTSDDTQSAQACACGGDCTCQAPAQEVDPAATDAPEVQEAPAAAQETAPIAEEAPATEATAVESADSINGESSFADQLDSSMVQLSRGAIITGTVVQVTADEVCVNVGYKSDGIVSRRDLTGDPSVNPMDMVKVGDEIEVEVIKVNDGDGNVILSKRSADSRRAWNTFAESLENGESFMATVTEVVKGGVVASASGVRVFIPASQIGLRFTQDLAGFIGQELELKVLEMDKRRRQIVASHRQVLEAKAEESKVAAWKNVPEPGTLVHSVVRRLTDFGAFCDIGGIDGLLHISDMSWGRPSHPREIVKPGDELTVMILATDEARGRVSLGLKQLAPRPWEIADQKYPVGTVVPGKVVRVTTFGAFVELEPGLDGLVHISQVAARRVDQVEDAVRPGDEVKVIVLEVKPEAKRISLSIRQAMDDDELAEAEAAMDAKMEAAQAAKAEADAQAPEVGEEAAPAAETVAEVEAVAQAVTEEVAPAAAEEAASADEAAPADAEEAAPVEEVAVPAKPKRASRAKAKVVEAVAEEAVAEEAVAEEAAPVEDVAE